MWREFRLGLRGIDDLSRDRGGRIEKTAASQLQFQLQSSLLHL